MAVCTKCGKQKGASILGHQCQPNPGSGQRRNDRVAARSAKRNRTESGGPHLPTWFRGA
jgi:hypothetical protein